MAPRRLPTAVLLADQGTRTLRAGAGLLTEGPGSWRTRPVPTDLLRLLPASEDTGRLGWVLL